MGRIKLLMVKRAAQQLLAGEHQFNEDFDFNKKILGSTMPSKPIRNKIAGYIARLMQAKRIGVRPKKKVQAEDEERRNRREDRDKYD
ncbi:MAG: 30S ribosomal protein S17e [Nanoarchaeota archaeon]|nr:30S ribosomal protein S17e [Nanoarchaeota archaeon]